MGKVIDVLEGSWPRKGQGGLPGGHVQVYRRAGFSDITRLRAFQAFEKKEKLLRLLDRSMEQAGIT